MTENAISEFVPLQGSDLLDRVTELVRGIGEKFFELGQHLYEIKHAEVYKTKDFGSWVDYCDAALPFQYRKADHYIELWELFSQKLGISWSEVEHIGWSKLIKVKGLIENKKDAKKWIKICEKYGRRELETLVKDEHARRRGDAPPRPPVEFVEHDTDLELVGLHEDIDGPFIDPAVLTHNEIFLEDPETGEAVPLHQFQVYLYADQWKNVMAAMERAAQLTNSDKACFLLDMIATEFNSTYVESGDGGVAQNLDTVIKNLERVFDVNIEVTVPVKSDLRKMSRVDEASRSGAKSPKKVSAKKAKKVTLKKTIRKPPKEKAKAAEKGEEKPEFRW